MVLFPLPTLYPSEVPGLSTTQSNQGPVSAVSAFYLKWRFVWKGVLMRELRCFLLDCRLTSGISTSSSWQRLPHQGMRQSGQGFYLLTLDFTLGGYTCGTGDISIGIYGKIQWYRAAAKWICLRLFTRARSLKKSLAAAAATSKSQAGVYRWQSWNSSSICLPSHSTVSALSLTLLPQKHLGRNTVVEFKCCFQCWEALSCLAGKTAFCGTA